MKTLFTKNEIESKTSELEEEIQMLNDEPKDGIVKRMIQNRKDKIAFLKKQELIFQNDSNLLNLKDETFQANDFEHSLIFLTARFKNGFFLGFWSHSPWGTCSNQEKGWAIINPEILEVIDFCETKSMGNPSG